MGFSAAHENLKIAEALLPVCHTGGTARRERLLSSLPEMVSSLRAIFNAATLNFQHEHLIAYTLGKKRVPCNEEEAKDGQAPAGETLTMSSWFETAKRAGEAAGDAW